MSSQVNRLVIFDWDGTLVTTTTGKTFANTPDEWKPIPGRAAWIQRLQAQGVATAIATNQGGIAFGYHDFNDWTCALDDYAAEWFGIENIQVCPHHPKGTVKPFSGACGCRKPEPGLLLWAMRWPFYARPFLPSQTLFVGDMDSDREAAERAGCRFAWAYEHFQLSGVGVEE